MGREDLAKMQCNCACYMYILLNIFQGAQGGVLWGFPHFYSHHSPVKQVRLRDSVDSKSPKKLHWLSKDLNPDLSRSSPTV